jgi:hypothetical protein
MAKMAEVMYPQLVTSFKDQISYWTNDDLKPIQFLNIKPLFRVYLYLISITLIIFMCEIMKRLIAHFVHSFDLTVFLC